MSLRQRILSLMAHGDYDPVLVAAVLDIDVSVVAAALTDPAYTPRAGNWATLAFSVAGGAPLTADNDTYQFGVGDIAITSQSGTDFSVGTVAGHTAVKTAGGGRFQFGIYWGRWNTIDLDTNFSTLRFLTFAAVVGSQDAAHNPLHALGPSVALPLDPHALSGRPGDAAISYASVPGYSAPGDAALYNPVLSAVGVQGTDSILTTFLETTPAVIWEV